VCEGKGEEGGRDGEILTSFFFPFFFEIICTEKKTEDQNMGRRRKEEEKEGIMDNLSRSFRSFDPMVVSHPFQCALSSMTRSALWREFLRLDGAVAVLILHYYLFIFIIFNVIIISHL
jgi:hypothetical protein